VSALRNGLIAHLKADAGIAAAAPGGVWPGLPPKDRVMDYPFVSVTVDRAREPERTFGKTPAEQVAFERERFLVKVIDKGTSPKRASDLNALVQTALDGADVAITGYELITVEWKGDIPGGYPDLDDGGQYQHEGGKYEVWASKS